MAYTFVDLMRNVPASPEFSFEPFECIDSEAGRPFNLQINDERTAYLIRSDSTPDAESDLDGLRILIDKLSEKLKNIRHDIVASLCTEDTDVKFSEIDPNYDEISNSQNFHRLTPDFWCPERRFIGELATVAVDDEKVMRRSFDNKMLKYKPYLSQSNVERYYVFVVSPNKFLSNYPMDMQYVNLFCQRMRFAMSVEAKLVEEIGEDIFVSDEENSTQSLITIILASLKKDTYIEGHDFTNDQILGRSLEFAVLWKEAKERYTFLRDTIQETMDSTGLNALALKYFLESVLGKERKIRLNDTTAKGSSVGSAMTRIFWPNLKVRSSKLDEVEDSIRVLRSNLFACMNYFYSKSRQESLISDLLKTSEFLGTVESEHSRLSKNLSIMRQYILGEKDKAMIIEDIKKSRVGTVGYFSIRQNFEGKGVSRQGPGQWRGEINNTYIVIDFDGDTITSITASTIMMLST